MRRAVTAVFSDLRNGRNIETYLTVLISLVVLILDVFGAVQMELIVKVLLALLGLLAIGDLATRNAIRNTDELLDHLGHKVSILSDQLPGRELLTAGVSNAYPTFSHSLLNEMYRDSKTNIRILQTWFPQVDPFPQALVEAIHRGVEVQILLLDPRTDIAKQRLRDLGRGDKSKLPVVGLETLDTISKRHNLQGKEFEVRFYSALPPFTIYSSDNTALVSFFWHGRGSTSGPMFEVQGRSSGFGLFLHQSFELIWSQAYSVDYEEIGEQLVS